MTSAGAKFESLHKEMLLRYRNGVLFMNEITVDAFAKVNLALEVMGLREDGYHEVLMLMQQLVLKDRVTVRRLGGSERCVKIVCEKEGVPLDETNLAWRAAMLMLDMAESLESVEVEIEKNIPMAAGLAGGSSDAAATIKAMNEVFELNLDEESLCNLAGGLGADVPFCVLGGTAVASGIGTDLVSTVGFAPQEYYVLLCKPPVGVSTREVYKAFDAKVEEIRKQPRPDVPYLVGGIVLGSPVRLLKGRMVNDLEYITSTEVPDINDIKAVMLEEGAAHAMMTGSGPTVFGIFEEKEGAVAAFKRLSQKYEETYITTFR